MAGDDVFNFQNVFKEYIADINPHKPPYEERQVVRSLDELSNGKCFLRMYDPRSEEVMHAGENKLVMPSAPTPTQVLLLDELAERKASFLASGYVPGVLVPTKLDLAELGVIPYEDGTWNQHYYITKIV